MKDSPDEIVFDGSGISLLASAGITSLFELAKTCHEREIKLDLRLSQSARKVLDLVGLWWLGLVDDGLAVQNALSEALRAYSRMAFEAQNGNAEARENTKRDDLRD